MKHSEIIKLLSGSQEKNPEDHQIEAERLQKSLSYDFRDGFEEKVLTRIYGNGQVVSNTFIFEKSFNLAFYRIAFTAAAAVVILLISIYMKEGSFTLDSLLGINDLDSESIVCMLTGN